MDVDRFEIRLSGSGGQGIILASIILAEAAGIIEGYNVSQTQSYGPEARGGRCKAEVVISSKPIDYPKAVQLDMMLAMNQASCDAYFYDFKPNGLLLDYENVLRRSRSDCYALWVLFATPSTLKHGSK